MLVVPALLVLYLIFLIGISTFTEFNPDEMITTGNHGKEPGSFSIGVEYTMLGWNIGYAGLGREMDFFYEGGKQVRAGKKLNTAYLEGIRDYLANFDNIDFILLQEVDFRSARSYHTDQEKYLARALGGYQAFRAVNYKSFFVPIPLTNPMGRVESGLVTLAGTSPLEISRIASPLTYPWPKRLFTPKRGFLLTSYKTANNHILHIINLHNSAYDDAGNLRETELKVIREFGLAEYAKGNYVIFGGDWNQNPPGIKNRSGKYIMKDVRPVDPGFMPEYWCWAYDDTYPTNRDVNEPFNPATTPCSVIDFFLCSPNVDVNAINAIDLGFEYSDHNPVFMRFTLRKEY